MLNHCNICGRPKRVIFKCKNCGRKVCLDCFTVSLGVCFDCSVDEFNKQYSNDGEELNIKCVN